MRNAVINIRYALRLLRRNAAFTSMAVAALSLGIAANTAIFSVVNKVLLEPLPYPDPDRLVQLMSASGIGDEPLASVPKFATWSDHTGSFQSMAAYDTAGPSVNLTEGEYPLPLETARVSADYFRLFGARVIAGRTFSAKDDQPGAPCVVVIGRDLWRNRFGGNPRLVGSSISLDHEQCKVVGVLDSGFHAGQPIEIWLPLQADPTAADHMNRLRVVARLREDITIDDAANNVASTMKYFLVRYPYAPLLFQERFTAVPLRDALVGDIRRLFSYSPEPLLLCC